MLHNSHIVKTMPQLAMLEGSVRLQTTETTDLQSTNQPTKIAPYSPIISQHSFVSVWTYK